MDEADDPPSEARLASWCKTLTERYERRDGSKLMLALAGQLNLRSVLFDDHESVLRNLHAIELSVLTPEECFDVIDAGLAHGNATDDVETTIDKDAKALLAEFSDGYPHFLQHFCYRAFAEDTDDHISREDVEAVREGGFKEIGEKFFEQKFISEIGSEDYRRLLRYLAPNGMEFVSRKDMIDGSGISEKVVDNALRVLSESGFLVRDEGRKGMYRLPTNAYAAWLMAFQKEG